MYSAGEKQCFSLPAVCIFSFALALYTFGNILTSVCVCVYVCSSKKECHFNQFGCVCEKERDKERKKERESVCVCVCGLLRKSSILVLTVHTLLKCIPLGEKGVFLCQLFTSFSF